MDQSSPSPHFIMPSHSHRVTLTTGSGSQVILGKLEIHNEI